MKKYYPITKNPDGYTSNFFIHASFNPHNELKEYGVQTFIIKRIPMILFKVAVLSIGITGTAIVA
jgi:hypothetical protein